MLALLKEGEKEPGETAGVEMLERWGSPSMWAVGISLQLDEEKGRGKQEERGARPPRPGGPLPIGQAAKLLGPQFLCPRILERKQQK